MRTSWQLLRRHAVRHVLMATTGTVLVLGLNACARNEAATPGAMPAPQVSVAPAWFIEMAVGANVILPIYRNDEKRFSTVFNFGDHLGVGYQFGKTRHQELMICIQHFSNGGIKHPNPGENFVQLRYSYRSRM